MKVEMASVLMCTMTDGLWAQKGNNKNMAW